MRDARRTGGHREQLPPPPLATVAAPSGRAGCTAHVGLLTPLSCGIAVPDAPQDRSAVPNPWHPAPQRHRLKGAKVPHRPGLPPPVRPSLVGCYRSRTRPSPDPRRPRACALYDRGDGAISSEADWGRPGLPV
ncbi:hypothetical protein STVIR_5284 [Streptomyces viridochromogenes Tue57]|uniref:Uncharacterized protein n=1 Tax=Streptomyces viridochromogenes Tue57 TaxID=1160705 RepID=L8PC87_STRVR|nr:hypothetical protein STVIR_5284 [Streptomyces viridochromogenes Tue57]